MSDYIEAEGKRYFEESYLVLANKNTAVARAEIADLKIKLAEAVELYHWRPIAELHEEYGPCVVIDINDPGNIGIGSNLDDEFDESEWTHFSRIAPLTNEEAETLLAAIDVALGKEKA